MFFASTDRPELNNVSVRRSLDRVAYWDPELPADLSDMLWDQPKNVLALGEPVRRSLARLTVRLPWGPQKFIMKHYVQATLWHTATRAMKPSRAWLTWKAAHRLADAGVATPRPVACIENRWGRCRRDSFLVYPYVNGCSLRTYLGDEVPADPSTLLNLRKQCRQLWERLAAIKMSLADTNVGNFVLGRNERMWVIDLDKTRSHWTSYGARRYQQRGWQQLIRSARMAGNDGRDFVRMLSDSTSIGETA